MKPASLCMLFSLRNLEALRECVSEMGMRDEVVNFPLDRDACFLEHCVLSDILDSLSTKRNLQRKFNPNVTQISQPMTDGGVANSPLFIGFQN